MKTPIDFIKKYTKRVMSGKTIYERDDPQESLDMEIATNLDEDFHTQFIKPAVKAIWTRLNDGDFDAIDIDEFDHYAIAFSNALDAYLKQWKKFNKTGWFTNE